jgi:DNA-binding transcriptional MocR family regulator
LFAIIAVPFDAYAALPRPEHRWLLTCLSRYIDQAGAAFPSLRQLARDARMSLSTVSRRLKEMADLSVFQRTRKGAGRYCYVLAEAYRPRWPGRDPGRVSAEKHRISQAGTQEANPPKQAKGGAPARQRFAKLKVSFGELPDERSKWDARLRGWRKSRFWLPLWGPRPDQPGCFAPAITA